MNLLIVRVVLVLSLFLLLSDFVKAQTFNTKSAEKFWDLVEVSKSGKSISDDLWKEYRNEEANKIWFGMAVKLDLNYELFYRNAIEIVFNPSRRKERETILLLPKNSPRNIQNIFVVGMYETYFLKEKEMKEFYTRVKDSGYLKTVYGLALSMLPKNFKRPTETLDNLNIYVHGIENGANAGKHGLIFSMAGLYNFEKENTGILAAHELHHILRKSRLKEQLEQNDEYAVEIMESCLNEGSADLISNLPVFSKAEFADLKERTFNKSEEKIKTIDAWFTDSFNNGLNYKSGDEINKLFDYLGGHNPGYYMALTIVQNGFREELRENVDNPFYFFRLYQKAAKLDKNSPPKFNSKTMKFVKLLEKKYYLKRN